MGIGASVPSLHASCVHGPGEAGEEMGWRKGGEMPKGTSLSPHLLALVAGLCPAV